jgi:uncharacterized ferritin-like protein (DUF455 family)
MPASELVTTLVGRQKLLFFFFVDIELPAAEICARMIVEYRNMPMDFRLDMARQVWDEVRHAELALLRCRQLGEEPDFRYTGSVTAKWSLGKTLEERLVIQQVIQEGNGLDVSLQLAALFDQAEDSLTADMLRIFCRDETLHAMFGNKWVLKKLSGDEAAYRELVDRMGRMILTRIPGVENPNLTLRALGGFPTGFLEEMSQGRSVGHS